MFTFYLIFFFYLYRGMYFSRLQRFLFTSMRKFLKIILFLGNFFRLVNKIFSAFN